METRGEPHPRPETLAAFLAAELAPHETRAVVAHLVRGCDRCREELVPRFESLWPEASLPDEAYDAPVDGAIAAALDLARDLARARARAAAGVASILAGEPAAGRPGTPLERWAWCGLLLELLEVRGLQPTAAVELAEAAAAAAEGLADHPFTDADHADLRSRAWAALGNARRMAGDLDGAEAALARALARLHEGSGSPVLAGHLAELTGSLLRAQRRFPEAHATLEACRDLHLAHGERHLAGRALVVEVAALVMEGSAEAAVATAAEAFALLDARQEPELVLFLAHNALLALVDLERHEEAAVLLPKVRALARTDVATSSADELRLRSLEARIEAGAGRSDRAERLLREVVEGLDAAGLGYAAAIEVIELAAVLLEDGRASEALPLLDRALETFSALRIAREAMAAVVLLRQAVAQGEATAALARTTISTLGRLGAPVA